MATEENATLEVKHVKPKETEIKPIEKKAEGLNDRVDAFVNGKRDIAGEDSAVGVDSDTSFNTSSASLVEGYLSKFPPGTNPSQALWQTLKLGIALASTNHEAVNEVLVEKDLEQQSDVNQLKKDILHHENNIVNEDDIESVATSLLDREIEALKEIKRKMEESNSFQIDHQLGNLNLNDETDSLNNSVLNRVSLDYNENILHIDDDSNDFYEYSAKHVLNDDNIDSYNAGVDDDFTNDDKMNKTNVNNIDDIPNFDSFDEWILDKSEKRKFKVADSFSSKHSNSKKNNKHSLSNKSKKKLNHNRTLSSNNTVNKKSNRLKRDPKYSAFFSDDDDIDSVTEHRDALLGISKNYNYSDSDSDISINESLNEDEEETDLTDDINISKSKNYKGILKNLNKLNKKKPNLNIYTWDSDVLNETDDDLNYKSFKNRNIDTKKVKISKLHSIINGEEDDDYLDDGSINEYINRNNYKYLDRKKYELNDIVDNDENKEHIKYNMYNKYDNDSDEDSIDLKYRKSRYDNNINRSSLPRLRSQSRSNSRTRSTNNIETSIPYDYILKNKKKHSDLGENIKIRKLFTPQPHSRIYNYNNNKDFEEYDEDSENDFNKINPRKKLQDLFYNYKKDNTNLNKNNKYDKRNYYSYKKPIHDYYLPKFVHRADSEFEDEENENNESNDSDNDHYYNSHNILNNNNYDSEEYDNDDENKLPSILKRALKASDYSHNLVNKKNNYSNYNNQHRKKLINYAYDFLNSDSVKYLDWSCVENV